MSKSDDLWQVIHQGSSVNAMLQAMAHAKEEHEAGAISKEDRFGLQARAFSRLRELTAGDLDSARVLISDHLLPHCFVVDPDISLQLDSHRECLAEWISGLPTVAREELLSVVVERLLCTLEHPEPRGACWTLAKLGYRTDRIISELWSLAHRCDDVKGDTALSTIASLGVPRAKVPTLLEELHQRARRRYTSSLNWSLARISDPSSVQVIVHNWLRGRLLVEADRPSDWLFPITALKTILDMNYIDSSLQDSTWASLRDLAERTRENPGVSFVLESIAPSVNTPDVVSYMLLDLASEDDGPGDSPWRHYLVGSRLEECDRPRQLVGWSRAADLPVAMEVLRRDACRDTGSDQLHQSRDDMVKAKAWETLLRAGHTQTLTWFTSAVANETSRLMRQRVMDWLSCFRLPTLPAQALEWITEEHHESTHASDGREIAFRLAAVQLARSSGSRQAFEALRTFGLTIDGKALMQSLYALAEVALSLIHEGDTAVVDKLVTQALSTTVDHQRSGAVYALERIASLHPDMVTEHVGRITAMLEQPHRPSYEWYYVVSILKHVKRASLTEELINSLQKWARHADEWISQGSLEVLGVHGCLHRFPDLLADTLGLRSRESVWSIENRRKYSNRTLHVIGLLYYTDPEAFEPAIIALLEQLSPLEMPHITEWLAVLGKERPEEVSTDIICVLIRQIRRWQSCSQSTPAAIQTLGIVAPEALALENWSDEFGDWLEDSCVALADVLGEAPVTALSLENVLRQLMQLCHNGQYSVRRAAYRAMAHQSMATLYRLSASWADSSQVELRCRAAEAYGWLDLRQTDHVNGSYDLYDRLTADPEPRVREAAARIWREKRERAWAQEYLQKLLSLEDFSNERILSSWRYGDALKRVGDDACVAELHKRLGEPELPPHAKHWFRLLLKELEEKWREKTRKWPEPWFAWNGTVEEGHGMLVTGDTTYEVDYSLWSEPRSYVNGPRPPEWGGAVWHVPFGTLHRMPSAAVILEDGRQGNIAMKRLTNSLLIFAGQGDYPKSKGQ